MSITIKAVGTLKQHLPSDSAVADVATVGQAIERLALPEVGSLLMLVNGQMVHWHTELRDGDTLELIPAMCGGTDLKIERG